MHGIKPGETFTYRFKIRQAGTYWYHSHSGGQEQEGMYAPIVIAPAKGERDKVARDYVVMLSDHHPMSAGAILRKLKQEPGYFNDRKRTLPGLMRDLAAAKTTEEKPGRSSPSRLAWGEMRMDPTDLADVTGYTFLVNGRGPNDNWTGPVQARREGAAALHQRLGHDGIRCPHSRPQAQGRAGRRPGRELRSMSMSSASVSVRPTT